jgi:uracil-DNA glycosylase
MGSSDWNDQLDFFNSDQFDTIVKFLVDRKRQGVKIFPSNRNILRAFELTPFNDVKVVILGQDPYYRKGQAQGLAFSVPNEIRLPPSLRNIYKELESDLGIKRDRGDLTDWATQGVLLLNTTLTVEEGSPDSHKNLGWRKLTKEVITTLNDERERLVFILWGAKAQAFATYLDSDKHCVIMSTHPSPLSAHRGFFGSKPFSKTNVYLKNNGLPEILWNWHGN